MAALSSTGGPRLLLVLHCDVDPDDTHLEVKGANALGEPGSWEGVSIQVPELKTSLSSFTDAKGQPPIFTWYIRSDESVSTQSKRGTHPLEMFSGFWTDREAEGDELAWHPHYWRKDEQNGSWGQENADHAWMRSCLDSGLEAYEKHLGRKPTSVRTGWSYNSNQTMAALSGLGMKADFTCMPGLKSAGHHEAGSFTNDYDWSVSPETPYHPSKADYRRPAKQGEEPLSILEVPLTTFPYPLKDPRSGAMGIVKGLGRRALGRMAQLSPLLHPGLFSYAVERELASLGQGVSYLSCYFHPNEILTDEALSIFQSNVRSLVELTKNAGVPLEFVTADALAEYVLAMEK